MNNKISIIVAIINIIIIIIYLCVNISLKPYNSSVGGPGESDYFYLDKRMNEKEAREGHTFNEIYMYLLLALKDEQ